MSDRIKHKRSSVSGKIPTTAQLEQGELGINTADGKIFLNKNGSSIEQVLITNTAAPITGSLRLSGSFQLTGSLTTDTPTLGDNTKKVATTEFVQTAITAIGVSIPLSSSLASRITTNTLNDLATSSSLASRITTTNSNSFIYALIFG